MKSVLIALTLFAPLSAFAHGGGGGGTGGVPPYQWTLEGRKVCKQSKEQADQELTKKQLKRYKNLCPKSK
ncbi:hypothetical protein SNR37_003182 [Agarivorans aestuarii]|uniref:Uncharacterized protein n=1 Tax=Agarivorans aestuarii TaxID=1563703 RepID=A0ABU7G352_9ALTE|nr:hypothetical protein [Agarivorans aestuarii]MEE1673755.1 hypothetical protein [Agarivorans aestuarii]